MTFDPHAFADWCREKPAEEEYTRLLSSCALAQFGFEGITAWDLNGVPLEVLIAAVGATHDTTFGALADRLAKMGY